MLRPIPDRPPPRHQMPWGPRVMIGTISGMIATIVVHPLDFIKVRLQLLPAYCTTREMARKIIICRGYKALYCGITAGLMRQATYTTTRLAVFHGLHDRKKREKPEHLSISEKLYLGVIAGLAGAFVGNPSEVVLVRLMADGSLEPCMYYNIPKKYKGAFHALCKIWVEEGVCALWRGGTLTMARSVLLSCATLGSYTQAQKMLHQHRIAKGPQLHIYTSMISSFFTAVLSLPVDLVKTKYQVKKGGVTQSEIFTDIYKQKGIMYFWKGFIPYYVRMAIHTMIVIYVVEELNYLFSKYIENKDCQ